MSGPAGGGLGELVRRNAARHPERCALVTGSRRLTYAEILDAGERAGRRLASAHRPAENIACWAPNSAELVALVVGAAFAGLRLVPLNPMARQPEVEHVVHVSHARSVFVAERCRDNPILEVASRRLRPELDAVIELSRWLDEPDLDGGVSLPVVAAGDPLAIIFTSGTTGRPKGATLSHAGIATAAASVDMVDGDVFVAPLPLHHVGGLTVLWSCFMHAATCVLMESFDPARYLDLLERERANVTVGVPTMLIGLLERPDFSTRDLGALRTVLSGGATMPVAIAERIERELGVQLVISYGQTESHGLICKTTPADAAVDKARTVGRAVPGVEVRIVDPTTGTASPPGAVGELWSRGPNVMLGYFDRPDQTAEVIDRDGWLRTGDLATMDDRGYCTIVGRMRDMIVRGGENVYPREIEEVLLTHPGVADVAVVGCPDERWGEQIVAFVRRAERATVTARELESFLRERLAPHKVPRHWEFVTAFPMTAAGKIQKHLLQPAGGDEKR